ncbi:hypothetical protein BN1088_1500055 [Sphingobacterium sp. PM2-P1-29]|nr:hypothetical protein BN1088_1500055 [Sphingobacterium sp. PM2-P1-29]
MHEVAPIHYGVKADCSLLYFELITLNILLIKKSKSTTTPIPNLFSIKSLKAMSKNLKAIYDSFLTYLITKSFNVKNI